MLARLESPVRVPCLRKRPHRVDDRRPAAPLDHLEKRGELSRTPHGRAQQRCLEEVPELS